MEEEMDTFYNASYWAEFSYRGYGISEDGTLFCEQLPHVVSSGGMWEMRLLHSKGLTFWEYSLPVTEAVIVSVLCLWQFFYFLLKKLRLPVPKFTSMMLAGAALSQTSLLPDDWTVKQIFFPDDLRPKVPDTIGGFAFVLYWFLEGVKMDVGMVKKTGSKVVVTGMVTVLFPIFVANMVFGKLRETGGKYLTGVEYRTILFMQSISAFTGISRLIRDLQINHSEFGRIVLSTAMVADVTGFGVNLVALVAWSDWRVSSMQGVGLVGYVIVMICVVRPAMFWVIRRTPEERPVKECFIYIIMILAFVYEALTIIVVVSVAKIIFTTIPPLLAKMPLTDSFVMALILSNKGIVELCYFMYSVEARALQAKSFTTMALMILISSTILPVTVHYLYDSSKRFISFQKRNLMTLKLGSELRFVLCIHKADHIEGMINLLEKSFPLEDSSITCYVLHLVELVGLDNPLFISHQMQTAEPGSRSYSNNVLIAFDSFKHYWKSVSLELFTSVSNPKYMHQEIYSLALDKQASFIMLPFHRIWSLDQTTVVSDDVMRRNTNINILRQAPCSVGIFVHRQNLISSQKNNPSFKVCAIFVGGKDDREALALGRQMMRNQNVSLTVLKLVPETMAGMTTGWDQMLDTAEVKEVLRNNNTTAGAQHSFVEFVEETVKDGSDTSTLLLSIANSFDLFVVGRSAGTGTDVTSALTEWTDFHELGVIGDLLISEDFPRRASVLVVQQQQNVACR
ncbi:PREDICTED: cation/H(+) antiporter 5-like [Camelina sativa]|uniref:Cation/H(+) antiporter 5-like n=1 Tax=Camelina sativa TaxID=90675 RepID=A0ABM1R7U5_CAMSA|nr:PREDICTED: cation/H(+) antiporter 5-like [Camelina sativa]